jgi:hypothetical protein
VQRLGNLERRDGASWAVDGSVLREQPAVEEHPNSLDRVERHALGAVEDAPLELVRKARCESFEQRPHRPLGQRLERDRGRVSHRAAEVGRAVEQLRPREHQHEDRAGSRPLQQMLDERE